MSVLSKENRHNLSKKAELVTVREKKLKAQFQTHSFLILKKLHHCDEALMKNEIKNKNKFEIKEKPRSWTWVVGSVPSWKKHKSTKSRRTISLGFFSKQKDEIIKECTSNNKSSWNQGIRKNEIYLSQPKKASELQGEFEAQRIIK